MRKMKKNGNFHGRANCLSSLTTSLDFLAELAANFGEKSSENLYPAD